MNTILRLVLIGGLLSAGGPGMAAAPAELERLSPLIDPDTVLIAELNLGKLDVAAAAAALISLLPEPRALLAEPIEQAGRQLAPWHQEFRQAGGDRLYVLLSLNSAVLGSEPPLALVVPLSGDAQAGPLQAVFTKAIPAWRAQVLHGCLVTAPGSVLPQLAARQAPGASGRWPRVFDGAPPGLVRVFFLPYAESARVVESLLPTLPRRLGGGPGSILSRGVQWATLTFDLPPDGAVLLNIQSESAEAAVALREAIEHGLNALDEARPLREHLPAWTAFRRLVLPVATDNRLRCRLEFAQLTAVLGGLQPALEATRGEAIRVALMNQLKQIGLGLIMQANDQGDRLPPHLVDILKSLKDNVRLLVHPDETATVPSDFANQSRDAKIAWIDAHTPFVYVRPGANMKEIKSPMTSVLVHERPKPGAASHVAVLFADGHVEVMTPEKLQSLLEPAGARPQ